MGNSTGIWKTVYHQLRGLGPDQFVKWEHLETITTKPRYASRAALVRARQQLECMDGLTLTGQNADGFWIRRQQDT